MTYVMILFIFIGNNKWYLIILWCLLQNLFLFCTFYDFKDIITIFTLYKNIIFFCQIDETESRCRVLCVYFCLCTILYFKNKFLNEIPTTQNLVSKCCRNQTSISKCIYSEELNLVDMSI